MRFLLTHRAIAIKLIADQASTVHDLTSALFQKKSLFAAIDPAMGKYLTVSVAYRGKLSMRDCELNHAASGSELTLGTVETAVYDFQNKVG